MMRWEPQFSLKRLLVGVTIICAFCAFPILFAPLIAFAMALPGFLILMAMAKSLNRKTERRRINRPDTF
jgi:hypothetical protein